MGYANSGRVKLETLLGLDPWGQLHSWRDAVHVATAIKMLLESDAEQVSLVCRLSDLWCGNPRRGSTLGRWLIQAYLGMPSVPKPANPAEVELILRELTLRRFCVEVRKLPDLNLQADLVTTYTCCVAGDPAFRVGMDDLLFGMFLSDDPKAAFSNKMPIRRELLTGEKYRKLDSARRARMGIVWCEALLGIQQLLYAGDVLRAWLETEGADLRNLCWDLPIWEHLSADDQMRAIRCQAKVVFNALRHVDPDREARFLHEYLKRLQPHLYPFDVTDDVEDRSIREAALLFEFVLRRYLRLMNRLTLPGNEGFRPEVSIRMAAQAARYLPPIIQLVAETVRRYIELGNDDNPESMPKGLLWTDHPLLWTRLAAIRADLTRDAYGPTDDSKRMMASMVLLTMTQSAYATTLGQSRPQRLEIAGELESFAPILDEVQWGLIQDRPELGYVFRTFALMINDRLADLYLAVSQRKRRKQARSASPEVWPTHAFRPREVLHASNVAGGAGSLGGRLAAEPTSTSPPDVEVDDGIFPEGQQVPSPQDLLPDGPVLLKLRMAGDTLYLEGWRRDPETGEPVIVALDIRPATDAVSAWLLTTTEFFSNGTQYEFALGKAHASGVPRDRILEPHEFQSLFEHAGWKRGWRHYLGRVLNKLTLGRFVPGAWFYKSGDELHARLRDLADRKHPEFRIFCRMPELFFNHLDPFIPDVVRDKMVAIHRNVVGSVITLVQDSRKTPVAEPSEWASNERFDRRVHALLSAWAPLLAPAFEKVLATEGIDWANTDLLIHAEGNLSLLPLTWLKVNGRTLFHQVRSVTQTVSLAAMRRAEEELNKQPEPPKRLLAAYWIGDEDAERTPVSELCNTHESLASSFARHGWTTGSLADAPRATKKNVEAALADRNPGVFVVGAHGSERTNQPGVVLAGDRPGDVDVRVGWDDEDVDLSRVDLTILLSCTVGKLENAGYLASTGMIPNLIRCGARSILAPRWHIRADEGLTKFVTEVADQYLKRLDAEGNSMFLRARAVNDARRQLFDESGEPRDPSLSIHNAAAFELYNLP